jgi:RNase P protein component
MKPHQLHHHLVGVGGAVERAGARRVVGLRFCLKQTFAVELALRVELARLGLVVVGKAGRHRAARNEDHRQMRELQRADQQARYDLVAHAQAQCRVEGVV